MPSFPKPGASVRRNSPMTRKEKDAIRTAVFNRAEGKCEDCGKPLILEAGHWGSMHLSHNKSKGAGGSWDLSNLECLCLTHHLVDRHNPKSVPSKI